MMRIARVSDERVDEGRAFVLVAADREHLLELVDRDHEAFAIEAIRRKAECVDRVLTRPDHGERPAGATRKYPVGERREQPGAQYRGLPAARRSDDPHQPGAGQPGNHVSDEPLAPEEKV